MARINWNNVGLRTFQSGIDHGVLYIDGSPGVPWFGLVNVGQSQSGGEAKARYRDGIKISNRASPEEFEGTIEAFMYPLEFERCDGTYQTENGLRITQQRRKSFGMTYRTRIGNDVQGLGFAYEIHILYGLRAEPSDRPYQTLTDQIQPTNFSWKITARAPQVEGYRPSAHYILDSRDVPKELLSQIEDYLYGTDETDPALPTAGELLFMFDSYLDQVYDAGTPYTPVFATYDAGDPFEPVVNTIDGGAL